MAEPEDGHLGSVEVELRNSRARMDAFSQELKILLVEINIVSDWISQKFGVELIDKASQFFKHLHDFHEIEDLTDTLSLIKKGGGKLRKRKAKTSPVKLRPLDLDSEEGSLNEEGGPEAQEDGESFFDPPECLLDTDVEDDSSCESETKPKRRRRGRKKKEPKPRRVARKKVKKDPEEENEENDIKEEVIDDEEEDYQDEDAEGNDDDDSVTSGTKKKKKYVWKPATQEMQCEECGKILKGDSSLRCHMLMHADLRPHECPEPGCGKRFRNKTKLGQHIKIHGSEKTEICNFCGRGFLRRKDLVIHERTHTGEKPFSCLVCPKSFNIKEHLTIHLRVHTGERPYRCETCDKSFSQANSLRIHKKIHLKQAGDFVPAPRKPRAPRKPKPALQAKTEEAPIDVVSTQNSLSRHRAPNPPDLQVQGPSLAKLEKASPTYILRLPDEHVQQLTGPPPHHSATPIQITPEQQHTLLVQTFFQQAGQALDPVQQAWNFGGPGTSNQDERGPPPHSPHNLALHHSHALSGFKLQQGYPPPPQQNLNMIRPNPNSPHHSQPFGIPQFHDPNFRHFPH